MPEQNVYGLLPLLMCREVIREDACDTIPVVGLPEILAVAYVTSWTTASTRFPTAPTEPSSDISPSGRKWPRDTGSDGSSQAAILDRSIFLRILTSITNHLLERGPRFRSRSSVKHPASKADPVVPWHGPLIRNPHTQVQQHIYKSSTKRGHTSYPFK